MHAADTGMACPTCTRIIRDRGGYAGWTLRHSCADGTRNAEPCAICHSREMGVRFFTVKLMPRLRSRYPVSGRPVAYLKDGHTALCWECATKQGMDISDGREVEESTEGLECYECSAVIVERSES